MTALLLNNESPLKCVKGSSLHIPIRVTQTKQGQDKVADYLHEVDKPLARYRDDEDLEKMLKDQEREDDPMLAYMKQKKTKQNIREGKKGMLSFLDRILYFN